MSRLYRWRQAGPARQARAEEEAALTEKIRAIHTGSKGAYGVSRIARELWEEGASPTRWLAGLRVRLGPHSSERADW
ncbi:IS3 family transposase [Streptomyces microflavus]|uniref:IS3 family transposase n=1 Tax=Streptomyces microflavus TaxID=1919 RepID=UPI003F4B2D47